MTKLRRYVVVVDDEALIRDYALDILRTAGLEVRGFGSAAETLAFLRDHAQDTGAVFADLWLESPYEGIGLTKTIAATWPWIALLITSGASARPPGGLPMKAHFVPKPWRAELVLRYLKRFVGSVNEAEAA